jgi:hypothetical protein
LVSVKGIKANPAKINAIVTHETSAVQKRNTQAHR